MFVSILSYYSMIFVKMIVAVFMYNGIFLRSTLNIPFSDIAFHAVKFLNYLFVKCAYSAFVCGILTIIFYLFFKFFYFQSLERFTKNKKVSIVFIRLQFSICSCPFCSYPFNRLSTVFMHTLKNRAFDRHLQFRSRWDLLSQLARDRRSLYAAAKNNRRLFQKATMRQLLGTGFYYDCR